MKINDLRHKRGEVVAGMRKMIDAAEQDGRDLSADEVASYNKMDEEQTELKSRIDRMEAQAKLDSEMDKPVNVHVPGRVSSDIEEGHPRGSKAYSSGFLNYCRVGKNGIDANVMNALQIGTDSEGGYIVPQEFEARLVEAMADINEFRNICTSITTDGDRHIPVEASQGQAQWTAEEGAYGESDPSFGRVTLGAHKLATIVKVSEELLQDSIFDLETYMVGLFARRFGEAEEAAIVNGDGTSKPTGIAGAATAGVTAAGAAAITSDELIDLYHKLKRPYRANAVWVMNDSTVKLVRQLKDSQGQYLWSPGLQAGQPDMLLGRQLVTSAGMPEATTGLRSVLFGDMSYVTIADRSGTSIQRLNELYAANGQVGFKGHRRMDSKLTLAEAVVALTQA